MTRTLSAAALMLAAAALPAEAQRYGPRDLPVPVEARQDAPGSRLQAALRPLDGSAAIPAGGRLRAGSHVAVCVRSSRAGYVSIWSRSPGGTRLARIYPNDRTDLERETRGGPIGAQAERCFGWNDGYRYRVDPPYGEAEVYVHWSPDLSGQFQPEDIPMIGEVPSAGAKSIPIYASRTLTYRVLE